MKLNIKFPETLSAEMILKEKMIPCVCRVGKEFTVEFSDPLSVSVKGVVEGWSEKDFKGAPALGGGKLIYFQHSQISLKKIGTDMFHIDELKMFCEGVGWVRLRI